jgi:hypothetical protein
MKDFIPKKQVENLLEKIHDRVAENLLNAIEKPLTTDDYQTFGYTTKKAMQNDLHRLPVHKAPNGKRYLYLSEFNNWVKQSSEVA